MEKTAEPVVSVRKISKSFSGVEVLTDIDIDIYAGKVLALIGENGAGKSTLVKIISGALEPTSGDILVDGKEVKIKNPLQARQHGITIINQEPMCFLDLNVTQNIFAGHTRETDKVLIKWKDKRQMARKLLDSLNLDIKETQSVKGMTIADQQMVEIVGALSTQANVLIMDEVTASLSMGEVKALFKIIDQLKAQGKAIVFIGHRLEEIEEIADHIVVLRDGAKVADIDAEGVKKADMVKMMIGREMNEQIVSEEHEVGDEMLRVENLGLQGKFKDISLSVRRGEIVGMAGLVGAGRSEVAGAIFGITPPDEGSIYLKGKKVRIHSTRDAISLSISLVPEDRNTEGLFMPMKIRENMTFASMDRISKGTWIDKGKELSAVKKYAELLRLKYNNAEQAVRELSGGNAQKVVLSKWLMTEPDLIILDEPTRGIDVGAKVEVYKLINELAKSGKAVLMISSEMAEVIQLSDRVYVMSEGRITAELQKSDLDETRIMTAAAHTTRNKEGGIA